MEATEYPRLYLIGVQLFNQADFFEAHEAWEDLWSETMGDGHRFLQGLIQAAVGLCHFCNGNLRGAVKLYHTSKDYMDRCGSPIFYGLDIPEFWQQMARCYDELLTADELHSGMEVDPELFPIIQLTPTPDDWPEISEYLEDEEET